MGLEHVAIRDFRNIVAAEFSLSAQLNLFTGANGAGKTSLLEALHVLGRAQSFRTHQPATLVREGADAFLVRGRVRVEGVQRQVGLQRSRQQLTLRIDSKPATGLAELASLFPYQVINPDSHRLLEGGPRYRRRFLDWGVFHVEPNFYATWQRYTRALRQRNAALRDQLPGRQVQLWDEELVASATELDKMRRGYLESLLPVLNQHLDGLLTGVVLAWSYRPGWSAKQRYAEALAAGLDRDQRRGFTQQGPHRADWVPLVAGVAAQERLSRGQQKQVVIAMMLAQAEQYQRIRNRPCLFLVDDLRSELDLEHCQRVLIQLRQLQAQVFLTAIDPDAVDIQDWGDSRRFHVERGEIQEVVY